MKQIRHNLSFHLLTTLLLVLTVVKEASAQKRNVTGEKHSKYNVLFLFIDDLRPDLGCYGNKFIHSPNIDRFASTATVFKKHFVVVPTCGPSRACLLTGKRPRTIDELSNDVLQIKQEAGVITNAPESFVGHLRFNGYYTVGIGKISHSPDGYIYNYLDKKGTQRELPRSWNEMLFNPGKWGTGWNAFFGYADGSNRNELKGQVKPYESAEVPDEGYPDGLTASLAIEKLHELAKKKTPFFMGVGFFKPHLPFNAPAKYWNMYDESQIPLTPSPAIPANIHRASLQESAEFNNGYKQGDEKASLSKPLSDGYAKKLKHGYYAGISYVDAQVGKVLETLKKLGLDENTIVVLWGDHGWHLGDDLVWGKHTLSEWSLRSPLIIKTPGAKEGRECNKIVSSVDIYPTLMELCGVEAPAGLDGKSFSVLLKDPASKDWNNVAYSYFKRGISIRTDSFRLTRYYRAEKPDIELYDHRRDDYENTNISLMHPEIIQRLQPTLENGNTGLYNTVPFKRAKSTSGE